MTEEICSLSALLALSTEPINFFKIQTDDGVIGVAVATMPWTIEELEKTTPIMARLHDRFTGEEKNAASTV